jgi:signal transduction protein with GAF and PtsI domain
MMLVADDGHPSAVVGGAAGGLRLDVAVPDLYTDLRITPLLNRLLSHSRGLLDTMAGSISLVDADRGSYAKVAENRVACQLGGTFSLDEGATGQAFARRMPVVIDDYSDLRRGHLPRGHAANRGAAVAVPLWWRGEVIGVNVAFAGQRRRFTAAELDAVELLTQSVVSAVVDAGSAGLLRAHGRIGAGGTGSSPIPAAALRSAVPSHGNGATPLTSREHQVLRLLAAGLSDLEVAARLVISPRPSRNTSARCCARPARRAARPP